MSATRTGLRDVAIAREHFMMVKGLDWNESAERCDINGDGIVDVGDLAMIYANFT